MLTEAAIDLYAATRALLRLSGYASDKTKKDKLQYFNGGQGLNETTVCLGIIYNLDDLQRLTPPQRGHLIVIVSPPAGQNSPIILYASNTSDTLLLLLPDKKDSGLCEEFEPATLAAASPTLLMAIKRKEYLVYEKNNELINAIYQKCIPRLPSDKPLPLSDLKTPEMSLANIGKSTLSLQDQPLPQESLIAELFQTISLEEEASSSPEAGEALLFQLLEACIKAGLFIWEISRTSTNLKTVTLMHPLTRQCFTLINSAEFASMKKPPKTLSKAPEKGPRDITYLSFSPASSGEGVALFIATPSNRKRKEIPTGGKNPLNIAYGVMGIYIGRNGQHLLLNEHAPLPNETPMKRKSRVGGVLSFFRKAEPTHKTPDPKKSSALGIK